MYSVKYWYKLLYYRIFRIDDRLLLIIAGSIVGVCSGLAAICLRQSLGVALEWLHPLRHYWWAFLLPAAGAAISSIYLEKVTHEGPGHGVPEIIYSISKYGGLLRFRSSYSRLISSFLTIGSGGSAGPEAPVVMSGSAIGSNIAKFLMLNDRQRVSLVGCGAAGAISAIFNAPIAGLVFAVEVILGEWKFLNIIPIAIAAVAGAEISNALYPVHELFTHQPFNIGSVDVFASIGLAVITAIISIVFARSLRGMGRVSKKVPLPFWVRAALGGCAVGAIGIFMPVVLGEGYHSIQSMISGTYSIGVMIILVSIAAKIFATAMTLGWGGSGGIFAPCLVIGSLTGIAFHRMLFPLLPAFGNAGEGAYALLGMAGLISGMLQAPLTGIFLIVEIAGGYDTILPLIVVSSLSSTLCHYIEPASFYLKELVERGQLLRPGSDARILSDLSIKELLDDTYTQVPQNMILRDFLNVIKKSDKYCFPIFEETTNQYLGLIEISSIRQYALEPGMHDIILLSQIMNTNIVTGTLENGLQELLDMMDVNNIDLIPILENDKFIGMISKAKILDLYRRELIMQTSIQ
jgi:chloride channel protein, CIC family